MFFSAFFIFMISLNNPFCDQTKDSLKKVDYSYDIREYTEINEVFDLDSSNKKIEPDILSKNIKEFFEETNLAIIQNKNMQPYIDRIEKESEIPLSQKNINNLPLRKAAYSVLLYQSIKEGNFTTFKLFAELCRWNQISTVSSLYFIAIYNRPEEYLNIILNLHNAYEIASTFPSLEMMLRCNRIADMKMLLDHFPRGVQFKPNGGAYIGTYVLPLNDLNLVKKHMTESLWYKQFYGINLKAENYEKTFFGGQNGSSMGYLGELDSSKVVTPIFTALSGIVPSATVTVSYKGATLEILKHLIEVGAKITPETLDEKSPYTLVEKSCRTPAEKKEVINYLKSIGIKDFGSKNVKQGQCKTDISEKGVYIYIDDKYSAKK